MNQKERVFVALVWRYYEAHGRHELPWRKTADPYHILVSELMLQQTQVDRALSKYRVFMRKFPTARRLAAAPLGEVVRAWQGLGYNRRAKFLHEAAKVIVAEQKGKWPTEETGLRRLPGIGPYTAAAVMAFAYNSPVVLIETNVRQVFLHHFFKNDTDVSDTDILKLVAKTLPTDNPREWYWALMDYGAYLKREYGNVNHRSKHYAKQSKFQGSDRQIRGAILRVLSTRKSLTTAQLEQALRVELLEYDGGRVAKQLARLQLEGFLLLLKGRWRLE
ncbi:A/G-specific adenine glycosylase [Candidatus Kaiserbacteria bacterium]|nr:A/G-specific adenine glycosylase [Candidatus Kaiserbacteria bacterium]